MIAPLEKSRVRMQPEAEETKPEGSLPPVLVYHKVDRGFELGVNIVSPGALSRQMRWLAARGLVGIPLAEALERPPGARPAVVLTFDDGYESALREALPVLAEVEFRATVFVPSAFAGGSSAWDTPFLGRRYRHLDAAGLRTLAAAGWEIGSHSATHADLRRASDASLEAEVAGSRRALEEMARVAVRSFAYPFGRADARVRAAVIAAGYRAACGSAPGGLAAMRPRGAPRAAGSDAPSRPDLFAIPRLGVRAVDGLAAFRAKVMGGRGATLERLKESLAHAAAGGTPWSKSWLPFS